MSSGASSSRAELLAEMESVMRDNASRGLLMHQAIADRFGLGPTDIKCLDLAREEENLTAGRLAEITGLSTSAVTALLDRLEKADFIRRRRDPSDRRRVFVVSTGRREAETARAFAPLRELMLRGLEGYSEDELRLIRDFLRGITDGVTEIVRRYRAEGP
ncbi:MarR family winged helix-turn-helix transcriptional regulator [Allokutzneria albata]|uniref:DNA-binding transcriptional regulator, MarR family n=1 Tax=Allokutzneria albata TaxID=211114 RepID=A0A1H0B672_ALLAB|nr:MarR family transcriptional regulator [Allokutzneria albata]SDN41119.1 DNA-binding transcriptional regulator, MarR family [Allokutzneria albata]